MTTDFDAVKGMLIGTMLGLVMWAIGLGLFWLWGG